jgi:hypothetical protein
VISDDELRGVFRAVLDDDPECPLKPGARQYGSDDPAVVWLMTGFLVATVHKMGGEIVATERARRIVADEFAARRLKRQSELS